jgi:hypothetical protein
MAKAYKCDRCKQYKDGGPHAELQQRKIGNPEILTKQLCEECSETLELVANGGYSE